MIRLIQLIIIGHFHRWTIVKEETYKVWDGRQDNIVAHGNQYILQCEKCGCMKKFRP